MFQKITKLGKKTLSALAAWNGMRIIRIKNLWMIGAFLLLALPLLVSIRIASVNADQECGGVQGHGTDDVGVYIDMHGCDRFYVQNSYITENRLALKGDAEIKSDIEKIITDKTYMDSRVEIDGDKITNITLCSGECWVEEEVEDVEITESVLPVEEETETEPAVEEELVTDETDISSSQETSGGEVTTVVEEGFPVDEETETQFDTEELIVDEIIGESDASSFTETPPNENPLDE